MLCKKSVAMSLAKRWGSPEAKTSMPKGACPGCVRSAIRATERAAAGSSNQLTASSPAAGPQKGALKAAAAVRAASLAPSAKSLAAKGGATSQTLMATCGTANCVCNSRAMVAGNCAGEGVISRLRIQFCILSAMLTFSWPCRSMSTSRDSRPRILSRNMPAWRSCKLTARAPCPLESCTVASNSA